MPCAQHHCLKGLRRHLDRYFSFTFDASCEPTQHSATTNQIVTNTVARAQFDSHVAKLRQVYKARRDHMLAALTREMAHDFGPLGVRVNAIAPGEVETAILSPGTDKIVEKLPMQRLGQPKEVADVIWFLCSDQSSYISGAEIEVNGAQHV